LGIRDALSSWSRRNPHERGRDDDPPGVLNAGQKAPQLHNEGRLQLLVLRRLARRQTTDTCDFPAGLAGGNTEANRELDSLWILFRRLKEEKTLRRPAQVNRWGIFRNWPAQTIPKGKQTDRDHESSCSCLHPAEQLDAQINSYEHIFGEQCGVRLSLPALRLEVANVGSTHLISASENAPQPFGIAQEIYFVESVKDAEIVLKNLGATTLRGPERGPRGSFMIIIHPDGFVVEYIDQGNQRE
jgi:hypothetical protein